MDNLPRRSSKTLHVMVIIAIRAMTDLKCVVLRSRDGDAVLK